MTPVPRGIHYPTLPDPCRPLPSPMTELQLLTVGALLGMQHATEADHLAAVATLAARQHTLVQGMKQGAAWGLGHGLVLLAVGGVALALGRALPAPWSHGLEMAVGAMLLLLGADTLRRRSGAVLARRAPDHARRGGPAHAHGLHSAPAQDRSHASAPPWRALAVGMVHGLAGSAALVLLSLNAVQSWPLGLAYIALFGAGSMAGMAMLSLAIALPLHFSARRLAGVHRGLTLLLGLVSCAIGAATLLEGLT